MSDEEESVSDEHPTHLRVTHFDGKFGVARLANDDHNLAPDEPVFVFRGSDWEMADVLRFYADACERDGSPDEHVAKARAARDRVLEWQTANPGLVRAPD